MAHEPRDSVRNSAVSGLPVFRLDATGRVTPLNDLAAGLLQRAPSLAEQMAPMARALSGRQATSARQADRQWLPLIIGSAVSGFLRVRVEPVISGDGTALLVAVEPDDRWQHLAQELEELESKIVLFECDAEGRFISGGGALLGGGAARQVVPWSLAEVLAPESRKMLAEHWKRLEKAQAVRGVEMDVQWSSRQRRTFWFSLFPLQGPDGSFVGVRGIARDISLQRGMAYALEAADERFNVLFRESSDPVVILGSDGSLLAANPAFEKLTGVRADELVVGEKRWEELIHPEDQGQLQAAVRECLASDTSVAVEYQLLARDGSYVWIEQVHSVLHDESGRPRGVLAIGRDITRRRQREIDLSRTTAETLSQHQRAQELIVRMTRLFRDVSELPHEFERYVEGMGRIIQRMFHPLLTLITDIDGECLAAAWRDDIPPPGAEEMLRPLSKSMAGTVISAGLPYFQGRLTGTPLASDPAIQKLRVCSLLAAPARDAAGQLRGLLLVADDQPRDFERAEIDLLTIAALQLAGRMQAAEEEAHRRRLEEHLIQAQKMDAVGMLAGGIAHDFNNILSGILGFASMMRSQVEPGSDLARYLKLIEQSAGRAAELTGQLLSFSRKSHMEKQPVRVRDVIEEVLSLTRPSQPRNIEVEVHWPEEPLYVLADKSQMIQVVMNLCINAIEAMKPSGGWLHIGAEAKALSEEERRMLQQPIPGRAVCITVSDSGPGIDPEVRAHIFDPFFTTKEEGTGLGLSIVYGIVTNHGGDVLVESEEGKGTTFYIYLPEYVEKPPEAVAALTGADTVLVVDDEMIVRQMIAEILKASGYPVLEAGSGTEALELLSQHKERVGLVILDMIMPGMDGEQTFGRLRQVVPDLPVILTSGYVRSEQYRRLLKSGRVELIRKPFKSSELVELVRSMIGQPVGEQ